MIDAEKNPRLQAALSGGPQRQGGTTLSVVQLVSGGICSTAFGDTRVAIVEISDTSQIVRLKMLTKAHKHIGAKIRRTPRQVTCDTNTWPSNETSTTMTEFTKMHPGHKYLVFVATDGVYDNLENEDEIGDYCALFKRFSNLVKEIYADWKSKITELPFAVYLVVKISAEVKKRKTLINDDRTMIAAEVGVGFPGHFIQAPNKDPYHINEFRVPNISSSNIAGMYEFHYLKPTPVSVKIAAREAAALAAAHPLTVTQATTVATKRKRDEQPTRIKRSFCRKVYRDGTLKRLNDPCIYFGRIGGCHFAHSVDELEPLNLNFAGPCSSSSSSYHDQHPRPRRANIERY